MPAAPAFPRVGGRLGPYELIAPLGIGGMSEVHRARDTRLGREVAVKVLDFDSARHPERLRLFEHEARAAGAIEHPAIVSVHDVGREGELPYVVMELVEGETLQRRLLRGRLPIRKAIDIAVQIGHGLAAAHARGILHNDLKPANVILARDGRVKILDFGLAGLRGGAPAPTGGDTANEGTVTQALFGTPGYVAPERIDGAAPDARSDVFSLGAVLYEMLAGVPAFDGATTADILRATTDRDPPEADPPLPTALAGIVHRALEKDPAQRFHSASDLAFALEAVSTITGSPVAVARRRAWRWPRFLDYTLAAVALAGLGLAAGRLIWDRPMPQFQRLTGRYGTISSARFGPGGQTVVFSGAWADGPRQRTFKIETNAAGDLELAGAEGDVAAISPSGEMALLARPQPTLHEPILGPGARLVVLPMTGGAPRELLGDVIGVDWSPRRHPDGSRMALVRERNGARRLEFPLGRVLYQTGYGLRGPRFSPSGDLLAVVEDTPQGERILVIDGDGRARPLAEGYTHTSARLGWSPDGREVWFSAERLGDHPRYGGWRPALRALTLSGRERVLLRVPEFLTFQDVAPDGRVLVTSGALHAEILGQPPGERAERNLSWHEGSNYTELSQDGKLMLYFEAAEAATYMRPTAAGPATRLGDHLILGLSPDGKWAVRIGSDQYTGRFLLVPTQGGEPRYVAAPKIQPWGVRWFADGRRLLLTGHESGRGIRAWVVDTVGGTFRPITPEGTGCWLLSPDDKTAACARPGREGYFYGIDGGESRSIPGFVAGDHLRQWTADGRHLVVSESKAIPARLMKVDVVSGERTLWKEIAPQNPVGVSGTIDPAVTPDLSAWVYSVLRHVNDLYLVEGLR
jgi:Tol biopolymer transport system component